MLVCSGSKTKLLVIGTKELRKSKLLSQNKVLKIEVAGHEVTESTSERLLGMVINNTMTWEHHLYGNDEHKGLISKLSQRSGIIWKLSFIMPKDKLRIFARDFSFLFLTIASKYTVMSGGCKHMTNKTGKAQLLRKKTI